MASLTCAFTTLLITLVQQTKPFGGLRFVIVNGLIWFEFALSKNHVWKRFAMYHTLSYVPLSAGVFPAKQWEERAAGAGGFESSGGDAVVGALHRSLAQAAAAGWSWPPPAGAAGQNRQRKRTVMFVAALYDVVTVFLLFIFMQKVATMIAKSKALLYVFWMWFAMCSYRSDNWFALT